MVTKTLNEATREEAIMFIAYAKKIASSLAVNVNDVLLAFLINEVRELNCSISASIPPR